MDQNLFRTEVVLNERIQVRGLIDTGAHSFGICAIMAANLGLPLGATVKLETSNGTVIGHRVHIPSVRIGPVIRHDVAAVVYPPNVPCEEALVGMSFLRRLSEIVIRGDTLELIGDEAGSSEVARQRCEENGLP